MIADLLRRDHLDLGAADTLLVGQHVVLSASDPETRAVAVKDSEENFGYRFDKRLDDSTIERQEADEQFSHRYFDDASVEKVLVGSTHEEACWRIRGGEAA